MSFLDLINKETVFFRDVIMQFINLCENCTLKQAKAKKSIVVKPILSDDFNSRCQVDLIDLQSRPDCEYRFIMVYQVVFCDFVPVFIMKLLKIIQHQRRSQKKFSGGGAETFKC